MECAYSTNWNENLPDIEDVRKSALINDELSRLKVDIAALQETCLADSGSIKEKDYSFFWQGKAESEVREHGVGFAVKNTLLNTVELKCNGSERLQSLRLKTSIGQVTLISAYAPTLSSTPEAKDMFYDNLSSALSEIPTTEQVIILGDINARVGSDNSAWDSCIGCFSVGNVNENGQRLLEVCSLHSLCVTNTYFKTKPQHRVSWRHPRSKHWHQLDLILVRQKCLKFVKLTRSFHSADCDTDHSLECCKINLLPKKIHHTKQIGRPQSDISKMCHPDLHIQFAESFEREYKNISGNTEKRKMGTPQVHHIKDFPGNLWKKNYKTK
ncbi:craniofacial development protein 2-like [Biomphalaria glabrata]|uniref:Craniofacial development protein 2-like n=1 Tax=Biomphalaria glabrata TaxID=6526 RepID=A0A9W3A8M5_BIOGL|nr:craniofacial development protein 2-like [Biomphalaria glabrata]